MLIFKELLKYTEPTHPDYLNIQEVLEAFLKINKENEQHMDDQLHKAKLEELERKYLGE